MTSVELGGRQPLDGIVVELVQPSNVRLGELLVGEVGEWLATPQTERRSQRRHGARRVPATNLVEADRHQLGEPVGVDRVGVELEAIPGRHASAIDGGDVSPANVRRRPDT